jgi:predicted Zn finger-like uncharacterized protein
MILTCPDCATSYFVDDDRIPALGRTVKCSSCGVRWRAMPTPPDADTAEPELQVDVDPDPTPILEAPAAEIEVAAPIVKGKPPQKPLPWKLLAGLGGGIILILTLAGLVIFRQPLVSSLPSVAPAYELLGLKVDALGVKIEGVSFEATFEAGRPVLMVKGSVRNIRREPQVAPPITIRLLDEEETLIGGVAARTLNATVPSGGRRYFAIAVPNPPAGIATVEIAFDKTAKGAAEPRPAHPQTPAEAPAAPAAVEAKPLPADSPDALAPHAEH